MRECCHDVVVMLLYTEDCPNWRTASERLREALHLAGRDDVDVEHRLVTTPEQAEALGFPGSPTVLLDGCDPFADRPAVPGLSCRVYSTETGYVGAPSVDQLLAALR